MSPRLRAGGGLCGLVALGMDVVGHERNQCSGGDAGELGAGKPFSRQGNENEATDGRDVFGKAVRDVFLIAFADLKRAVERERAAMREYARDMNGLELALNRWHIPLLMPSFAQRARANYEMKKRAEEMNRLTRLQQVPGWQEMSIGEAGQAVQRSAFPGAYADHERDARTLASALTGNSPRAFSCRIGGEPDEASDDFRARA